jgi:hypothetical protein
MRVGAALCALFAPLVSAKTVQAPFAAGVPDAPYQPPFPWPPRVLDQSLTEQITRLLKEHNAPGYSIAVVRPDAAEEVEYFAWGNRTEDGAPVTPNVCYARS